MERRRRGRRTRARRQGRLTRALWLLSAAVVICGAASRLLPGGELSATLVTTPAPTAFTMGYDETVTTREIVAAGESWWCIQSGVFAAEAGAKDKSAAYTDRGAPGYVLRDGEKWRVLLGAYETKADAQRVRDRLLTDQEVETFLHELTCPGLHLRLTGMVGQLDVLDAALTLLPELARQMRAAAQALDGRELTLKEAAAQVSSWQEQLKTLRSALETRFVPPDAPLVSAVRQALGALEEAAAGAARAQGTTAQLSAELKMGALLAFDRRKAAWETILAQ